MTMMGDTAAAGDDRKTYERRWGFKRAKDGSGSLKAVQILTSELMMTI
jgi:hypothetical protein